MVETDELVFWNGCCYLNPDKTLNDKNKPYSSARLKGYTILEKYIMQYTGLKDKNGKEIYEGDILEFDKYEWYRCFTKTKEDIDKLPSYYFDVYFDNKEGWCGAGICKEWKTYCKIVGNIYEHPKILKATN